MQPTDELRSTLRRLLNETIPDGSSDSDTAFTDQEIDELLLHSPSIYAAASLGWTIKAGRIKERIEKYTIGQETYDKTTLKDMVDQAIKMAKQFAELAQTTPEPESVKTGYMLRFRPPEVL